MPTQKASRQSPIFTPQNTPRGAEYSAPLPSANVTQKTAYAGHEGEKKAPCARAQGLFSCADCFERVRPRARQPRLLGALPPAPHVLTPHAHTWATAPAPLLLSCLFLLLYPLLCFGKNGVLYLWGLLIPFAHCLFVPLFPLR